MDTKKPLVTVIVAVYNISTYVRRCVDSVLNQTYDHLEILLVDDGSTDGSGQICDEYAKKDARIRVIHKTNGGLSDARNAALDVASGDYIGYVDGDDWIEPGMYEAMVNAAMTNDAQIAVCRYQQRLETDLRVIPMEEENPTGQVICYSAEEALASFICDGKKYKIHNSVWSKLFSIEVCRNYRFPKGKNSEDIMYTTRTFCDATRVAFVDTPFYNYVVGRTGSIMNVGLFQRRVEHEIPFWQEQVAYLREKGYKELADKALFFFYRRLLFYYREAIAAGQKEYAKAIAKPVVSDRQKVRVLVQCDWVNKGDAARMKLFAASPYGYEMICKWYDSVVIPLKRKLR